MKAGAAYLKAMGDYEAVFRELRGDETPDLIQQRFGEGRRLGELDGPEMVERIVSEKRKLVAAGPREGDRG